MVSSVVRVTWQPILDGEFLRATREVVQDIARSLQTLLPAPAPGDEPGSHQHWANANLSGGDAGIAVFFHYMDEAFPGEGYQKIAIQFLERAIDTVSEVQMLPALYGGFTGVAYAVTHVETPLSALSEGVDLQEVDAALGKYLTRTPWPDHYDLINGLVGFGVYMLQRLPRKIAIVNLERIVAHLSELAERSDQGITWHTSPEQLPLGSREQYWQGWYNLGVAHGVPGVIALLGEIVAENIAQPEARELLDGSVRWMLAQKLPEGTGSWFDIYLGVGHEPCASRLAWCYGDPGVSVALLRAAQCIGEPEWERAAIEIAKAALKRPLSRSGVSDASLCHGSAGLGHIFNRLYQSTREKPFRQAARFWFDHTRQIRRPGEGVGGFLYHSVDGEDVQEVAEPGILQGAAGIGLALLAAITHVEPAWDQMLLTAVRPHPQ